MALSGEYVPSSQKWVRDQVALFEGSGGAKGNTMNGDPIVVITSVGSASGKLRKNPVMRVERDGQYAAIASKGGAPDDPSWADNFRAHPEVELQDGSERHTYAVREAEGRERGDWWEHAVATWPTYGTYQEKTDRPIPVFVLTRVG